MTESCRGLGWFTCLWDHLCHVFAVRCSLDSKSFGLTILVSVIHDVGSATYHTLEIEWLALKSLVHYFLSPDWLSVRHGLRYGDIVLAWMSVVDHRVARSFMDILKPQSVSSLHLRVSSFRAVTFMPSTDHRWNISICIEDWVKPWDAKLLPSSCRITVLCVIESNIMLFLQFLILFVITENMIKSYMFALGRKSMIFHCIYMNQQIKRNKEALSLN